MRALPALPTLPNAGPEMPALFGAMPAAGFTDALLAFLSPESLPTLDAEAAKALGWTDMLRFASEKSPLGDGTGLEATTERADEACQAAPLPELALLAGLPIAAAVIPPQPVAAPAPAESAVRLQSALESLQSLGVGGPRELPEHALARPEAPGKSEAFTFEMLEAHFSATTAATAPHASPAVEAPPLEIEAPLGSAQFREQAADTLRWMVRQGESRAEITLRPAELGPIQIELKIVADRAEVVFVAAHPDTRDALQDQLPQLQELLAESGIELGQASVRDEAGKHPAFLATAEPATPAEAPVEEVRLPRRGSGLVDTFA